jgi:hypothetical protein
VAALNIEPAATGEALRWRRVSDYSPARCSVAAGTVHGNEVPGGYMTPEETEATGLVGDW